MARSILNKTIKGNRIEIVMTTALAVSPPCPSSEERLLIVSWMVDLTSEPFESAVVGVAVEGVFDEDVAVEGV